jgi:excisionase family DNA binding protein
MQAVEHISVTLPLEEFKNLLAQVVREELRTSNALIPKPNGDDLLTIKEACSYLGVSRPTVYALMKQDKLKYVYLAKNRLRFIRANLLAYVREQSACNR